MSRSQGYQPLYIEPQNQENTENLPFGSYLLGGIKYSVWDFATKGVVGGTLSAAAGTTTGVIGTIVGGIRYGVNRINGISHDQASESFLQSIKPASSLLKKSVEFFSKPAKTLVKTLTAITTPIIASAGSALVTITEPIVLASASATTTIAGGTLGIAAGIASIVPSAILYMASPFSKTANKWKSKLFEKSFGLSKESFEISKKIVQPIKNGDFYKKHPKTIFKAFKGFNNLSYLAKPLGYLMGDIQKFRGDNSNNRILDETNKFDKWFERKINDPKLQKYITPALLITAGIAVGIFTLGGGSIPFFTAAAGTLGANLGIEAFLISGAMLLGGGVNLTSMLVEDIARSGTDSNQTLQTTNKLRRYLAGFSVATTTAGTAAILLGSGGIAAPFLMASMIGGVSSFTIGGGEKAARSKRNNQYARRIVEIVPREHDRLTERAKKLQGRIPSASPLKTRARLIGKPKAAKFGSFTATALGGGTSWLKLNQAINIGAIGTQALPGISSLFALSNAILSNKRNKDEKTASDKNIHEAQKLLFYSHFVMDKKRHQLVSDIVFNALQKLLVKRGSETITSFEQQVADNDDLLVITYIRKSIFESTLTNEELSTKKEDITKTIENRVKKFLTDADIIETKTIKVEEKLVQTTQTNRNRIKFDSQKLNQIGQDNTAGGKYVATKIDGNGEQKAKQMERLDALPILAMIIHDDITTAVKGDNFIKFVHEQREKIAKKTLNMDVNTSSNKKIVKFYIDKAIMAILNELNIHNVHPAISQNEQSAFKKKIIYQLIPQIREFLPDNNEQNNNGNKKSIISKEKLIKKFKIKDLNVQAEDTNHYYLSKMCDEWVNNILTNIQRNGLKFNQVTYKNFLKEQRYEIKEEIVARAAAIYNYTENLDTKPLDEKAQESIKRFNQTVENNTNQANPNGPYLDPGFNKQIVKINSKGKESEYGRYAMKITDLFSPEFLRFSTKTSKAGFKSLNEDQQFALEGMYVVELMNGKGEKLNIDYLYSNNSQEEADQKLNAFMRQKGNLYMKDHKKQIIKITIDHSCTFIKVDGHDQIYHKGKKFNALEDNTESLFKTPLPDPQEPQATPEVTRQIVHGL